MSKRTENRTVTAIRTDIACVAVVKVSKLVDKFVTPRRCMRAFVDEKAGDIWIESAGSY